MRNNNNTREDPTHGHHQMVNTKIRLIIFFVAKDGEVLYNQQKQDQELTVAQIMNSLLPNSDLHWQKQGKPLDHSGMTEIKSLMIIQWKWEIDSRDWIWQSAWRTMDRGSWHCSGGRDQDHPQEKEMHQGKMVVCGGLTNTEKRREAKDKEEKERYTHVNTDF